MKEIFEFNTKTVKREKDNLFLVDVTKKIEFEFGDLARQADFSMKVTAGGTSVLCCVVCSKEDNKEIPSEPLIPLIVDYRERTYAAGKIPGGFFKREGKPREHEVHVSRLIDRTLRSLFPKNLNRDVHVSVLVLSFDAENDPTILAVLGSSLALSLSSIPFEGECSCFRLSKINNEYIVNPNFYELEISELDIIVSFYKDQILMIETEANIVEEKEIIDALNFLKPYAILFNEFQKKMVKNYGKQKFVIQERYDLENLVRLNRENFKEKIEKVLEIEEKEKREICYIELSKNIEITKEFCDESIINNEELLKKLKQRVFFTILREIVRSKVLTTKKRIDGRGFDDLREIKCQVGVLPRTHGSAIFQRGQTQALVTVTLGTSSDVQVMEELIGEYKERFIFHYNFPGFATGEVKPDRGVSRRELGHGLLAKKSLKLVIPSQEEFPYTIRIVSDILESNGSSSMASVCGATLALLDAGVKIKDLVAGVAMGLIKEENEYAILTDISGIEDHCGDMDFKISGTENGITAIQLDLKILGVPIALIEEIIYKSKQARIKILQIIKNTIDKPRETISSYAPKIKILQIPPEKIGDLIGPKGKTIKQIIEETQTKIEIEENGKVFISAENQELLDKAVNKIELLTKDLEVGKVYLGKVKKITNYGAFVEILPNKVGLLHISQFKQRTKNITDIMSEGEEIYVKVINMDEEGRPVLSQKGI
ncbi:MAG: polyribonucleotide nucleotidyltransferase [Elusimicrobiota bacterium]|nr:polyribonucleotide nucleotidyltransferase [Endomicrobiia bacterium]MDW8166067.1 polyribonucleotide nucleotidyltransferase [Elusimicrobiota bacterium]